MSIINKNNPSEEFIYNPFHSTETTSSLLVVGSDYSYISSFVEQLISKYIVPVIKLPDNMQHYDFSAMSSESEMLSRLETIEQFIESESIDSSIASKFLHLEHIEHIPESLHELLAHKILITGKGKNTAIIATSNQYLALAHEIIGSCSMWMLFKPDDSVNLRSFYERYRFLDEQKRLFESLGDNDFFFHEMHDECDSGAYRIFKGRG